MSFTMILTTILEWAVGLFIIWGFFNEEKLIGFEDRVAAAVKRFFDGKRSVRKVYGEKNC